MIILRFSRVAENVLLASKSLKKMPFIGQDWRSPGEAWVKYDGGWEKKSVVTIQDTVTPQHLDLILFKSEAKVEAAEAVIDVKPLNVGEAIATLDLRKNQSIRRKNLSECEQDKENHDPSRFEVMLQEHVRRIRGQIVEEQEINHNELPQDQESPQKSSR